MEFFSFNGFTKLNVSLQSILMGTILLLPFFFIDIFIFYRSFFILNPIYLTIVLSYVLAMSLITVSAITHFLIKASLSKDGKAAFDDIMPMAVSFAIFEIIITNVFIYVVSNYIEPSKATFKDFIEILIGIALLAIFISFILTIITDKKRKKKNIQLEFDFNKDSK